MFLGIWDFVIAFMGRNCGFPSLSYSGMFQSCVVLLLRYCIVEECILDSMVVVYRKRRFKDIPSGGGALFIFACSCAAVLMVFKMYTWRGWVIPLEAH